MRTTFLVGAGFCVDANAFLDTTADPLAKPYPLVGDLASACFDHTYDLQAGLEPAFQLAIDRRDSAPVKRLVHVVQAADYFVGSKAAAATATPYSALLARFPTTTFLSFNYDALLELVLYRRQLWTPFDGFGITCDAKVNPSYVAAKSPPESSQIIVLHLHGSVYLYPHEFETYSVAGDKTVWLRESSSCRYHFDPDTIGNLFIPFRGGATGPTYKHADERVIAPVPDKATALANRFVQEVYARATAELRSTDTLVAVGYRFALCDRSSYDPLLRALASAPGRNLLLVSPEATLIAAQLRPLYPGLNVVPFPSRFTDWVDASFPIPGQS